MDSAGEVPAASAGFDFASIPASYRSCVPCHLPVVRAYLGHGMAASAGPVAEVPSGELTHPLTGVEYRLETEPAGRAGRAAADAGYEAVLTAAYPDGGRRSQAVVGRIGAGIFDISWATAEIHPTTGEVLDRLFFAPVETVTGHGMELSPFDLHPGSAGLDMALTGDCLTCHTTARPEEIAGADPFPNHRLGVDAFAAGAVAPLGCDACHGPTERHAKIMTGEVTAARGDNGLPSLGQWPAAAQRDVCGRCHLQGDARFELASPHADLAALEGKPLAGRVPTFVAAKPVEDHRFVSQLERLALSACFLQSQQMTCTTCHDPHLGARDQGTASFDAACGECHGGSAETVSASATSTAGASTCSREEGLTVEAVLGEPARSDAGCVDCHMRRSQPFDLPHVRSADHWIQRQPPRPTDSLPHRQFADAGGELVLFDGERLAPMLASPEGARWLDAAEALAYATAARFPEALERFDRLPAPGSPEATSSAVPEGLDPILSRPSFHSSRALLLQAHGRFGEAMAAWDDAVALDPEGASSRLGRARLRLDTGDLRGVVEDTEAVLADHPESDGPWRMRAEMAERLGRPDMALAAVENITAAWPSDARAWHRQGLLASVLGRRESYDSARSHLEILSPELAASLPPFGQMPVPNPGAR